MSMSQMQSEEIGAPMSPAPADELRLTIAVVIASLGRPDLLEQMRDMMAGQSLPPDMLLFSVVSESDVPEGFASGENCQVIMGEKGLTRQRNRAIDWLGGRYDIIVFFDDDFVPSRFALEGMERFFRTHPEVVGATGKVIADGATNAGLSYEWARERMDAYDAQGFFPNCIVSTLLGLYGCNMAYRAAAIGDDVRFDERLRLYAWQEDIDFAGALSKKGRIVHTFAFAGVHLGVKHGRTPGLRLGYSQMINPAYLVAKGTMTWRFAARLMFQNFVANHLKAFRPEPWVDRKGRARGNWIGLIDIMRGRLTPERIEEL